MANHPDSRDQDGSSKRTLLEQLSPYVSLFVSVLALATSVWSVSEIRRHGRLSMRPDIRYVQQGRRGEDVGIYVENNGLGPARLTDTRVYLDKRPIHKWEELTAATLPLYKTTTPAWSDFNGRFFLRNGLSRGLYYTESDNLTDFAEFRRLIFERLFIVTTVCSLYEECEQVCTTYEDAQCAAEEKRRADPKG